MSCLAMLLEGCGRTQDHKGKTPLVEVAGKFLYREDLQAALPLNLSAEDSLLFSEAYIRNWTEDVLLFYKAEDNVRDSEKVKTLVESYRRALVMHAYQEELVKQQLAEEIGQAEMTDYYEKNKGLFVLENPIVKGLFIKVPLKATGLKDVRRRYRTNAPEAVEWLEKYSLRHAVTYDYFYDRWRPLNEVVAMLPKEGRDPLAHDWRKTPDVELKDTAFHYFLHIEEFLDKGERKPMEMAGEEIKEILINLKRVDFINRVKADLYRQASEKEDIKYYYLESDE